MDLESEVGDFFDSLEILQGAHDDYYEKLFEYYKEKENSLRKNPDLKEFYDTFFSREEGERRFFTIISKDSFNDLTSEKNTTQSLVYHPLNDHSRGRMAKGDIVFCYRSGQFSDLDTALDSRGIYALGVVASAPELLFPESKNHEQYGVLIYFPVLLDHHLEVKHIQMHPTTINLTPYNGNRNDALQYIKSDQHSLALLDLIFSKNPNKRRELQELLSPIELKEIELPGTILSNYYSKSIKKDDYSTRSLRKLLADKFVEWFYQEENYKASYEGLVSVELLLFWDCTYFSSNLLKVDSENIDHSITAIEERVTNPNNKWKEYSYGTSRGAPSAILGKNNYLKFLREYFSDASNRQAYIGLVERKTNCKSFGYTPHLVSKPFLLLAGISGTGKTRFVREQAKASGQLSETYCLTSVRPDWHEPSDLLGYISRLGKDGEAELITTDVLQFISKAWRVIAESGLSIEVQDSEGLGKRLVATGERDELDKVPPYWLCLDEMNLAPVEQYFADYLSVLETREWLWTGDRFTYSSDALLKPATIKAVADKKKLAEDLGFGSTGDGKYNELWELICQHGLGIPFNLLVAGTVNMDETTHGFSRKVIDRALTFDFGEFFPNHFDEFADFGTSNSRNRRLSFPIWSHASKTDMANTFDSDGAKTIAFFSAVNAVLENTPFELAFRALNELLLAVVSSQPQDDLTLKAVWDDFMMCKVLPRIEGDIDKLTRSDDKTVLEELAAVLQAQLGPIWLAPETDESHQRPDLYRENVVADGATDQEKVLRIPCRSKDKLQWMSKRLASATFTSFWP